MNLSKNLSVRFVFQLSEYPLKGRLPSFEASGIFNYERDFLWI
jgi:hypothetical protein